MVQYFGAEVAQARQFHLGRGFASPRARLYPVLQCHDGQTLSMDLWAETALCLKESLLLPRCTRLPFLPIRVRGIFSYLLAMKWIVSIPMYHQLSNSGLNTCLFSAVPADFWM